MFKRLKRRMLLLTMIILSLVMLLAFGVIYALTYNNVQQENARKLESLSTIFISEDGVVAPLSGTTPSGATSVSGQATIRGLVILPVDYNQSFTLFLQADGSLQEIQSVIDMPLEIYQTAAEIAQNSANGAGKVELQERTWQYKTLNFTDSNSAQSDVELLEAYDTPLSRIVFLDITDSVTSLRNLLFTFVAVGILMLVVLFGISWFFAGRTIKPMEENWDKQQRFIADASHELKTPLAIIGANIDALRAGSEQIKKGRPMEQDGSSGRGGSSEQGRPTEQSGRGRPAEQLVSVEQFVDNQDKWLNHVDAEVTRMSELISDLLYLAAVETVRHDGLSFDLSSLVESALASMEAVIFERKIVLQSSLEPDLLVKGDEAHCKQVVLILLDNAAKYTPTGGTIKVSLTGVGNHAICSVRNSGPGIPADKLPWIFDRFYRVDDARSSEAGGYGLGLSIAKAIIERQGGRITATSADGETVFGFTLKTL